MVRKCAPAVVCLAVLLFAIQLATATQTLHVNEAKIIVLLDDKQSRVSLELDNATGRSFDASFQIELLDPKDVVRATATIRESVRRGHSTVVVPALLPYSELREAERREFPWYRLRYRVTPDAAATGSPSPAEGVVSVSEVTPGLFEMRVVSARYVRPGARYSARVRAANPVTQRAVRNVAVEAEMKFDDGTQTVTLKARGVTGADGYVKLDFTLPRKIVDDGKGELKVTGRRGGIEQKAETEVTSNLKPRALLTTDKTLYQPGQVLHARALVFDGTERALPDAEVILKIEDEEGTSVFISTLKTSRFGVASADWQIPANARLGRYTVGLKSEDDDWYTQGQPTQTVKVSRYDLPNFAVTTKSDRAFYLGGQNAEVEVRADYLFGQPVKRGHVRVVRQTERTGTTRAEIRDEERARRGEWTPGALRRAARLAGEHKELVDRAGSASTTSNTPPTSPTRRPTAPKNAASRSGSRASPSTSTSTGAATLRRRGSRSPSTSRPLTRTASPPSAKSRSSKRV